MGLTQQLVSLQELLYFDFLGGPKYFKMRHIVNLFKGATFPYVILLMIYFRNYSLGMYLYLALHGSYGMIWLLKDWLFPDKTFDTKTTLGSIAVVTTLLLMYWCLPLFIASGLAIQTPSYLRVTVAVMTYALGAVLMIASDAQKTFTLRYKKGLISDGLFSYTRNPNYLGEVMIYGSFAIVTGYTYSYVILGIVWCTLFAMNMFLKQISYKKKEGWQEYRHRSYIFLPRAFRSHAANILLYVAITAAAYQGYYSLG